ncbi:hypothetical protein BDA99DRAFT_556494 [Phascolomyces articulosus]|uniref:Uncharacterized protein n=1 Tax=Phascolomyces articulosus TaxID=60185 RepID=A0AAD5PH97_9FUNG|nr:hypothetical protein BDA99DRAFT_556494 [Phascolomyces articulosus]
MDKDLVRNKSESRKLHSVGKRRRKTTNTSLQQQPPPQTSSSSSHNSSGSTPLTHHTTTGSSSTSTHSPPSSSDQKKLPNNKSIKAIHERIARLSMDNLLPNSKLPRRLQSSQSQQTRLINVPPTARATKSETTNINKTNTNTNTNTNNDTRNIRVRSKTTTTAAATAIEHDRRQLRKQHNTNLHSIWTTHNHRIMEETDTYYTTSTKSNYFNNDDNDDDSEQLVEAAQSRLRSLLLARERQLDMHEQLKRTFSDILDQNEESGTELIQQLRIHIDQQALHIQDLERALTRERLRKGEYRRKFEAEKQTLLQQQQEQFEALKSKYRVGLERIVDRWLSNEATEQEIWMDQIRQQADDRVALVEERWMERAALLQEELIHYRDQNLRNIVQQ